MSIWTELVIRVTNGETNIASPFAEGAVIQSAFYIVVEKERLGWGFVWCPVSMRGVRLSRMVVPAQLPVITDESFRPIDNYTFNNMKWESLADPKKKKKRRQDGKREW